MVVLVVANLAMVALVLAVETFQVMEEGSMLTAGILTSVVF